MQTTGTGKPPSSDPEAIERLIFSTSGWFGGAAHLTDYARGTRRQVDILSLRIDGATEAQRDAALSVLAKYGLSPTITVSQSIGGIPVLRLHGDDVWKFDTARRISRPDVWRRNAIVEPNGTEHPALNMKIGQLNGYELGYIRDLLSQHGVACKVCHSRSLGGVDVLRIEGRDAVVGLERLLVGISAQPSTANPAYPAETHRLTRKPDGSVIVHDANGLMDNPSGPAVLSQGRAVYALAGEILDEEAWSRHPRVMALQPVSGAAAL